MRIICADNEKFALDILVRAVQEAAPEAEVRSCLKVPDVFRLVQSEGFLPEVAFLDIEMPGMSGLELATELKKRCRKLILSLSPDIPSMQLKQ